MEKIIYFPALSDHIMEYKIPNTPTELDIASFALLLGVNKYAHTIFYLLFKTKIIEVLIANK